MKYCSNCGEKIGSKTNFCGNCGREIYSKNYERESIEEEEFYHKAKKSFDKNKKNKSINTFNANSLKPLEINNISSTGFFKVIIWIIIIFTILFLLFAFLSNIENSGGSFGVSSSKDDNWWGTTHKKTSVGLGGVKTAEHSCPFWNRDC